ncbi:hypothetical protein GCM10011428_02100 [Streptomyces violaceus]
MPGSRNSPPGWSAGGLPGRGQVVSVPPYTNEWWAYVPQYGGYISNIYISSPDNRLPNVPECGSPRP